MEAIWSLEKASWRPSGGLLEALGEPFGALCGLFGPSWEHLGRFVVQDAPKNSQRRSQESLFVKKLKKIKILGPEKGSKIGPKMAPKKVTKKVTPKSDIFTFFY